MRTDSSPPRHQGENGLPEDAEGRADREFEPVSEDVDKLAHEVVDAAFRVHKSLGPGLLESVYETCLVYELKKRGVRVESQVSLPVTYEHVRLESGLRLDILVEKKVIVEVKSVEKVTPLHEAQLMTYLKLTGIRLGLLLNFNVPYARDGIRRIVI